MLAAEDTAVGRKRARVWRGENQVTAVRGHECLLFDGETAPEQEHEILAHLGEALDDGVGELLPADSGVACRHVGADRERCVQEKDSLVSQHTHRKCVTKYIKKNIFASILKN